jgi:hypothetical protein
MWLIQLTFFINTDTCFQFSKQDLNIIAPRSFQKIFIIVYILLSPYDYSSDCTGNFLLVKYGKTLSLQVDKY